MMHRDRTTLIFLHIPKTGGTSLRQSLLDSIAPRPSIKLMHQDTAPLLAMSPDARAALGMVEGHMLFGAHEHIPGPYTYLTVLREPLARLRSWHGYVRQNPRHRFHHVVAGGGLSLTECIERRMTPELDNDMTRTLASVGRERVPIGGMTREMFDVACERLASIEFVGTTERLPEFHAMLCDRLGRPETVLQHLNRTQRAPGSDSPDTGLAASLKRPLADPENDESSRIIRETNGFDYALWERAGAILEEVLAGSRPGH